MANLSGRRVAILVTNGFERSELEQPRDHLEQSGAEVSIVSLKKGHVRSWEHTEWSDVFDVDLHIDAASPDDYDALVLPGGVMNPDFLRMDARAVKFVREFASRGKIVAAICHGLWTLIEADQVKGRKLTSYPSLRTDLENAGAAWINEEVVVDGNLITSRRPDDLPAFNCALEALLAEVRPEQSAAPRTLRA